MPKVRKQKKLPPIVKYDAKHLVISFRTDDDLYGRTRVVF
jgi:hypothetical protein